AGGGGWALVAALVAAGLGVSAGASAGVLDPFDLAAPLVELRPAALAPGLVALVAALWVVGDRGLRLAAAVGFVCALGPVLSAFGDVLTVGGGAVPLPAALVAAFSPSGAGWAGSLVVAAVAVALGLGRLARPRLALVLAPLALLEAHAVAGPPPTCVSLDVPVAVRTLGDRDGAVLNLPVLAVDGAQVVGGPVGAHALYLFQRTRHGRRLATGAAPLGASDPLYGEAAVVLALDSAVGVERWLLPPTRPGEVLRGLGVTEIVVHRGLFPARALALLDPVLFKLYGAPQRDHAGNVDLYRIATTGSARAPTAETLHPADGPPVNGWLGLSEYLAGVTPTGGTDAAAPTAAGRAAIPETPGARTPAVPPAERAPSDTPPRERPATPKHPDGARAKRAPR
ncbi:MAG: hypothetical protein Q8P41_11170, partial [Pseudomonadota bacterium]|nr:hypothetical protein [Pseudomonadota bacterium]